MHTCVCKHYTHIQIQQTPTMNYYTILNDDYYVMVSDTTVRAMFRMDIIIMLTG